MKIRSLVLTSGIALGSTIVTGAFTSARSVTLVNGNFTPDIITQSAYLGNTAASGGTVVNVPGWSFPAQIAGAGGSNPSFNGYNFIAPFADSLSGSVTQDSITVSQAVALNKTGNGNNVYLYSNSTVNSPAPAAGDWYIAADGAYQQGAIVQTLNDLVQGQSYDVTFYQAAGQQVGYTGATTDRFQVSLGTNSKLSPLINLASEANVTGWTKQTLSLTANSTSEVLSFLAVGTPNGLPPFALLSGVTVQPTAVPEPFTLLGTLTAMGLGAGLKSKLNKK